MIDRRDIAGLTVAVVGHAALVGGVLYFAGLDSDKPLISANAPIQVTLADDIGLVSAAPDPSEEPPAQAAQGEEAPPEPEAAQPEPQPEPEEKPKPSPPRDNADTADRRRPDRPKTNQQTQPGSGRPRPGLEMNDFSPNNGPARERTDGTGEKSQATMTGPALANITSAILRQVQPCADRQVIPAPEASQIIAIVQLRLNPDGSFAGLRILRHEGTTDANQRYVARVDDAVEAIFAGCTPIRGLPPELYDVPRGWRSITFRYRLTN